MATSCSELMRSPAAGRTQNTTATAARLARRTDLGRRQSGGVLVHVRERDEHGSEHGDAQAGAVEEAQAQRDHVDRALAVHVGEGVGRRVGAVAAMTRRESAAAERMKDMMKRRWAYCQMMAGGAA